MPVTLTEVETFSNAVVGPSAGDPRTALSVRTMGQPLANRTLWSWKRLQAIIGSFAPIGSNAPTEATADASTDTFTCAGHGLSNGDRVRFMAAGSGVIPAGLTATTVYYVVSAATDTFKVSTTSGGSAVNITDAGTSAFYVVKVTTPEIYLPSFTVGVSSTTTTAGRLQAVLQQFGALAATNVWSGLQTFGATAFQYALAHGLGTITNASNADIDVTSSVWVATTVSQQIDVEVLDAGATDGHVLFVGRDPVGAHSVVFHREGQASAIVTLGSAQAAGALLIRRGGNWRLLMGGQNTTAGAHA